MTTKQEAYALIDRLPEDSVKAVVQIMIRMIPPEQKKTNNAEQKKKAFPFDAFTNGMTYIADDFDATPECFREYT